jgi:hypothetical protein
MNQRYKPILRITPFLQVLDIWEASTEMVLSPGDPHKWSWKMEASGLYAYISADSTFFTPVDCDRISKCSGW